MSVVPGLRSSASQPFAGSDSDQKFMGGRTFSVSDCGGKGVFGDAIPEGKEGGSGEKMDVPRSLVSLRIRAFSGDVKNAGVTTATGAGSEATATNVEEGGDIHPSE
ncbi:hypothetical protein HK104_011486, partial [Borealophlyctis nickersoniae]